METSRDTAEPDGGCDCGEGLGTRLRLCHLLICTVLTQAPQFAELWTGSGRRGALLPPSPPPPYGRALPQVARSGHHAILILAQAVVDQRVVRNGRPRTHHRPQPILWLHQVLDVLKRRRVLDRRKVPRIAAFGDGLDGTAKQFAAARLRKKVHEMHARRPRDRA